VVLYGSVTIGKKRGTTAFVLGSRPSQKVRSLADDPNIIITGEVPDVSPFYRLASLLIAPLHFEGDTCIKILEAIAAIVSTTIAAGRAELRERRDIAARQF